MLSPGFVVGVVVAIIVLDNTLILTFTLTVVAFAEEVVSTVDVISVVVVVVEDVVAVEVIMIFLLFSFCFLCCCVNQIDASGASDSIDFPS